MRVDRDYAVFGELSYDITPKLTGTVGYRFYRYDNSLDGFFGFGANNPYGSSTGENQNNPQASPPTCVTPGILGGPCVDLAQEVKKNGSTPKFNLTYKFNQDAMVYATFSKGFRPGGVNRRIQSPPNAPLATYNPDYLTNYEIGYKTSWLDNHLRFNGAFFYEDWQNIQFGFLGQNSFTIVRNAGTAHIKGAEQQLEWVPVQGLNLHLAATELDPKMSQATCYDVRHDDRSAVASLDLSLLRCSARRHPAADRAEVQGRCDGTLHVPARGLGPAGLWAGRLQLYELHELVVVALPEQPDRQRARVRPLGPRVRHQQGQLPGGAVRQQRPRQAGANISLCECTIVARYNTSIARNTICASKPLATIATPRTIGIRFSQTF